MGLVEGQRVVVTGGGSGIGRATCRRLAEEGARVGVLDVDLATASETAAMLNDAVGPDTARAFGADVTVYPEVEGALGEAGAWLGGLDAIFNNAGAATSVRTHEQPPEDWERLIAVNLTGVFHGVKAAVPIMLRDLAAGTGDAVPEPTKSIVNMGSISGTRPAAGEAAYSAAKAGSIALTASLALEYAPYIRVNAVSPGGIRTNMTGMLFELVPGVEEWWAGKAALGRNGEPEDIADVVVFLCSPLARYVTGQNIVVDGGTTLHGSVVDGVQERVFGPLLPSS